MHSMPAGWFVRKRTLFLLFLLRASPYVSFIVGNRFEKIEAIYCEDAKLNTLSAIDGFVQRVEFKKRKRKAWHAAKCMSELVK